MSRVIDALADEERQDDDGDDENVHEANGSPRPISESFQCRDADNTDPDGGRHEQQEVQRTFERRRNGIHAARVGPGDVNPAPRSVTA